MISLKKAWATYKNRKTRLGIVIDFCLVALLIFITIPDLRMRLMVNTIRLTLRQPQAIQDERYYLSPRALRAYTSEGELFEWPDSLGKPLLMNFGALWSAQNRAELKSLNVFWEKYREQIDVLYITFDAADEVEEYMEARRYGFKRLYIREDEMSQLEREEDGMIVDLIYSIPSSVLLDTDERVVVKKFGAAKWRGGRVDDIMQSIGK